MLMFENGASVPDREEEDTMTETPRVTRKLDGVVSLGMDLDK